LLGDPKVIAALAIAIIATPPVVNGILAKALEQADTDWLKDVDFQGDPPQPDHLPDNLPPPGDRDMQGNFDGRGGRPPPCTPAQRDPPEREQLPPPINLDRSRGSLRLVTEPGDIGVGFVIVANSVTGTPVFQLFEGQQTRWEHGEQHVNEDVQLPDPRTGYPTVSGVRWELTWDLSSGVAHQSIGLQLFAVHCAEASR
jgi:hypothetical protein